MSIGMRRNCSLRGGWRHERFSDGCSDRFVEADLRHSNNPFATRNIQFKFALRFTQSICQVALLFGKLVLSGLFQRVGQ